MYKLMIEEDDLLIKGSDLEEILIAINFSVPEIAEMVKVEPLAWIPPVVRPANWRTDPAVKAQYFADLRTYLTYMKLREQSMASAKIANEANLAAYLKQFSDFAQYLSSIFVMVKVTEIGKDQNGVMQYSYRKVDPVLPNYTFPQAAQKLMGYAVQRPENPIDFICYNEF